MLSEQYLSVLSDSEKDNLRKYEQVFGTDGWKVLIEWALVSAENAVRRQRAALSWDEVLKARAQEDVYRLFASLEDAVTLEYANTAQDRIGDLAAAAAEEHE